VDFLLNAPGILAATHAVIVIAITIRVIMRRPDTGVALAWLLLVAILPFAGAAAYLLIGEHRISH
jgi:cardiolipin synthase